jgi:cysteinyl-tRNA synthetase
MTLHLYNTVTRNKEKFVPLEDGKVGMYVCGPTVYDNPHLGNALSVVVYDLLYRVVRYIYGSKNVTYVRNLTDVDDKINLASKERNIPISQLTAEITKGFHEDMTALNCLTPNVEPKATEHLGEMITMIKDLIKYKHAYESDGHVYFAVKTFEKYGDLSGRTIDDMVAGVRIAVSDSKKAAEDFVLWKPADDDAPESAVFDSPWGRGRPGWHIECSAMSTKYLGGSFDIHGGGVDLVFPHHTNEIAQSCCANPGSEFAKFWIHNGFLTVNGEKMSKSLGNFITVREALESGIPGEVIRYHLLSTNYRKPMDWNDKAIDDAKKALNSFYRAIQKARVHEKRVDDVPEEILACLKDDLNVPDAYAILHDYVHQINKSDDEEGQTKLAIKLKSASNFLGFLLHTPESWFKGDEKDAEGIEELVSQRIQARRQKNFALSDSIRDELVGAGVVIEDKPDGTTIWRKV